MRNLIKKYKIEIGLVCFLLAVFIVRDLSGSLKSGRYLDVEFFSVGQGDSIFIETPQRRQVLIDSGPGNSVLNKLGQTMDFYDRYIDMVVATHLDSDHVGGLIEVLKQYEIGALFMPKPEDEDKAFYLKELNKIIASQNIKVYYLSRGFQLAIEPGIGIYVLSPEPDSKLKAGDNDKSIVFRLVFNKASFLFTGDISQGVEKNLLAENIILDSDVLKIAHHGSKYSNSPEFLSAVSPLFSIISVGRNNKYGHPNEEVLERLASSTILRTDLQGDIDILSDGLKIWTRSF